MLKPISSLSLLLFLSLQTPAVPAQDDNSLARTSALLRDAERYEEDLQNLEGEYGPFDSRLLEPLAGIEVLYEDLGDFARVLEIQARRLQLVRTSFGLEHPDAMPLLEAMIATEIRLGNWETVSDHLDHLLTLAQANFGPDSDEVVQALERQASWYLARVYLDRDRDRAENFMAARNIYEDLLDMAEDRYGEESPELIPWLYKRAHSLSQLVALLNSEGSLRMDAVDETIREDGEGRLVTLGQRSLFSTTGRFGPASRVAVVNGQEPFGVAYIRLAIGYIDDIRDIAEAEGDWETWAMATIYRGDYSYLRGRNTGRNNYLEAMEKLQELGIHESRLEKYFNTPMVIPMPRFYSSFAELEAYQQQLSQGFSLLPDEDDEEEEFDTDEPWRQPVHLGGFIGWEDDIPATQRPSLEDPIFAVNLPVNTVDLSFRVNAVGRVSGVDALRIEPDERRVRSDAVRAARALRFRPALYEGRARARSVQMRYMILPE